MPDKPVSINLDPKINLDQVIEATDSKFGLVFRWVPRTNLVYIKTGKDFWKAIGRAFSEDHMRLMIGTFLSGYKMGLEKKNGKTPPL